jgi:colicin import membrane protein
VDYLNKHKEGLFLTILLHALLLLILLNFGVFTPLSLKEDSGVIIDFGTSDEGMGLTEPAPANVEQKSEKTSIPTVSKPIPPKNENDEDEQLVTQNIEKTAIIEEQRKKDESKHKQQIEDKRKRDSLQIINNERIEEQNRLAEIRRQDSLHQAQQNAQIAQINSRAKNVFGVSGQGTDPNSSGQGTSYKSGNQGSPDGIAGGDPNGNGNGNGKGPGIGNGNGTRVNFSLSGRVAKSLPKPSYPGNEEGIVVVKITVDKNGKVTQANPGAVGTKTPNQALWEAARKAALSTTFNQNLDAPAFQTGTITYKFVLD